MKVNLFFDMDGVLAEHDPLVVDKMYNKNFFKNRPPMKDNIKLIKKLIKNKDYNIYILSSVLSDSKYAITEKNEWLNKYLPEIDDEHRLFVKTSETKSNHVKNNVKDIDTSLNILFDDYSFNLWDWNNNGFVAIKILNDYNNTKGTWLKSHPQLVIKKRDKKKYYNTNKLLNSLKRAE